jgi:hypothetical protein
VTGEITEAPDVDCADVFYENPTSDPIDVDFWPEGRRPCARRRRRHKHDRPWDEGVGLDDDTEAPPSLLMPDTLR